LWAFPFQWLRFVVDVGLGHTLEYNILSCLPWNHDRNTSKPKRLNWWSSWLSRCVISTIVLYICTRLNHIWLYMSLHILWISDICNHPMSIYSLLYVSLFLKHEGALPERGNQECFILFLCRYYISRLKSIVCAQNAYCLGK